MTSSAPPDPRRDRRLDLVASHCASLDPATPTARQRLDAAIGAELAHMLVFALSGGGTPDRERSSGRLRARPVLAA